LILLCWVFAKKREAQKHLLEQGMDPITAHFKACTLSFLEERNSRRMQPLPLLLSMLPQLLPLVGERHSSPEGRWR
jgi:hypothetical protein